MILLILGLVLWSLAHVFKRAAPGPRHALDERLGEGPSKGIFALLIASGLVLMIWGYRRAEVVPVYDPPVWGVHLTDLAMLGAVALLGMGASKGRARSWLRNPMLTGVIVWAFAHLLVNGDLASVVLFGGLGLWAVVNIVLIDGSGPWERPEPGPLKGDLRLLIIALVVYAVITAIHAWLGVWPFPW